jgi:hypothetical protein
MSSATQKRELYRLTRSEATWLVETFMYAKKKGADGSIEPFNVFRNELETEKPAYLGKFNNSSNASVQAPFYKIANDLYNMLVELNRRVAETDHHKKTMEAAKRLPCKHSIAYLSATFLNWAIYNWCMKTSYPIVEDLGDNGYEFNTCAVCDFTGDALFYFSTAYGLEKPICENCLPFDAVDYEEEEGEYVVEEESESEEVEEEEVSETEAEASETEDASDDDDEDYEPSSESEEEEEEDEEDDQIEEDEEKEEYEEDDQIEEDEDESDPEDGVEGAEPLKYFGCTGCPMEWRAGYKHGYKVAMKEMRSYANKQKHNVIYAPECAVCEDSHEKLKKCGRCGLVSYCSTECQEEDWAEHKLVCRR